MSSGSDKKTPVPRNLRSNSQSDLTLANIRSLIEASKNEIIASVRSEIQSLKESVLSLTVRVEKLEEENVKLKNQQQQQVPILPLDLDNTCSEMVNEFQQRERRKLNIIIVGAPEQATGSISERKAFDQEQCSELFDSIGLSRCNIKDISRIGKLSTERRRLLRVTLFDEEDKRFLITHSRKLRHVDKFRNIYIKPDLTMLQRKIDFNLRKELRVFKSAHPEKDFVINRGKIIERNSKQDFQKIF